MAGLLSHQETPASLLDAALPRSIERAARKVADRLNTPVHVFVILSGARKGEYDLIEAKDTTWLERYRARSSAEERAVIAPSYDLPAPLHVMRDAQRRADRKGIALHLFRMKNGDYDGVFASDHEWLKEYRAQHKEVVVVKPERQPDRPAVPSPATSRPTTPHKKSAKKEPTPKKTMPKGQSKQRPDEPAPLPTTEETTPMEALPAPVPSPAAPAPPKERQHTTAKITPPRPARPKPKPIPEVPTPTVEVAPVDTAHEEDDDLDGDETEVKEIVKLLSKALAQAGEE